MKSMFEIYGGKAAFDQWDLQQRVTCSCLKAGDSVVFYGHGKRYEDKAYAKDGGVWADVPNFLLQKHGSIRVDLGHGLDAHLDCRTYFDVVKKDKPADYACPYNVVLEGGNSGGASSWNDLKDKPFYTETASVSVFENVEARYVEHMNIWVVETTSQYIPTDGECVTLVWNGARHELILAYDSELDDFHAPTEDGKATVSVWYDYDGGAWCWDVTFAELGTASLYITRETVRKLDAKYLPDVDAFIEDGDYTLVSGTYEGLRKIILEGRVPNVVCGFISPDAATVYRCVMAEANDGNLRLLFFEGGRNPVCVVLMPDGTSEVEIV